tara:strand:+ start:1019 stop:2275 length:1257 start_codon:yes stop_codon:yes gene_type:complete
MRKDYLIPVPGVECLVDALNKMGETDMAAQEVEMAQANLQAAQEKQRMAQEQAKIKTPDPRNEAAIEGQDKEGSAPPTDQPGSELPAEAPLPPDIGKTWFVDSFGMTGREMSDILIKSKQLQLLAEIQPLLLLEKQAILSSFKGVSPNLVGQLPLTDMDYDSLNKHSERLDLAFRRFVKHWTSSDEEGKKEAESLWATTIEKSERLSNRERNLLKQCHEILHSRGALNAQTLKSYGVQASPAEISSLIKSHGFLFDLISVGQFSKSVGRGLFYDVKRPSILLKDADKFIAGLIETNSKVRLDTLLNPIIEMPFHAPSAPWYADALCKAMETKQVRADEGRILIEGEIAVTKALEMAEPYLNGNSGHARQLLEGLRGNADALIVLAYENMGQDEQMKLLKAHRISHEEMDAKREAIVSG